MPVFLFLFLFGCYTPGCLGCATVTQMGDFDPDPQKAGAYLQVESVIIIWDSKTHTEHFIRKAEFSSKQKSIGFLVPTPAVPEMEEVDPKIFDMVEVVSAPAKIPRRLPINLLAHDFQGMIGVGGFTLGKEVTGVFGDFQPFPETVKEQDVAGYHATVLDASNITQLKNWLQANQFNWNAGDEVWLAPYIQKHWKLTAFKLLNPAKADQDGFATRTFRLSFTADRPFFPYSEPHPVREGAPSPRLLQVSLLSDQFMTGSLEEGIPWSIKTHFIGSSIPNPVITKDWQANQWLELAKLQGKMELPKCLMVYQDFSNPRPGNSDLIFKDNASLVPFRKVYEDYSQPVIYTWSFLDVIGILVLCTICSSLVYVSVRSCQIVDQLETVGDLTRLPPRTALVYSLDQITSLICLFFGFFFSLGFCFLPFPCFLKVAGTVRYEDYLKQKRIGFFHPLSNALPVKVLSTAVLGSMFLYVYLVMLHISW